MTFKQQASILIFLICLAVAFIVYFITNPQDTPSENFIRYTTIETTPATTAYTTSTTTTTRPPETTQETSPPATSTLVYDSAPSVSGWCDLVYQYDWPQETAHRICLAESHGDPNAVNMNDNHGKCKGSYGLMQTACFWFPFFGYEISFDPEINMQLAYKIWQRSGFTPWTTY